jgi:hypothetical protein
MSKKFGPKTRDVCSELACRNPSAYKMKGIETEGSGLWLSYKFKELLFCCEKHNICVKCNTKTLWTNGLCYNCDQFKTKY